MWSVSQQQIIKGLNVPGNVDHMKEVLVLFCFSCWSGYRLGCGLCPVSATPKLTTNPWQNRSCKFFHYLQTLEIWHASYIWGNSQVQGYISNNCNTMICKWFCFHRNKNCQILLTWEVVLESILCFQRRKWRLMIKLCFKLSDLPFSTKYSNWTGDYKRPCY